MLSTSSSLATSAPAARPKRQFPDWLVRVLSVFKPELRPIVSQLGKIRRASHAKARAELGWEPRTAAEAIVGTGRSLIAAGLV